MDRSKVVTAAQRAANALEDERAGLKAFRRAVNMALASRPVAQSAILGARYGGAASILEALDMLEADLGETHPFTKARRDIVQYERTHPDFCAILTALGVSPEWGDQLMRDAMAMGASPPDPGISDVSAAFDIEKEIAP
ncbi:hypothetical protein [Palleronia sp. LCG004]|uniref:hypothetical protein n=1 Tax=Palleronia sp. LCG004 TaxID=3079304 RepID=UPI0029432F7E|nr:hypothetical protein [Palleronia sp. LCG004]WOI54949.1 hypothetical protein RVY76_07680 [Palleronia sp. LCG004]